MISERKISDLATRLSEVTLGLPPGARRDAFRARAEQLIREALSGKAVAACDCGAETTGKWADKHHSGCAVFAESEHKSR